MVSSMAYSGDHVSYVGKSKMAPHSTGSHSYGGGVMPMEKSATPAPTKKGLARDTAEQLYFQLKEFEDFRQPGFNVLYVQIPRPEWARNPLAEAFSAVISETAEFLEPVTRLWVPRNSLRDKLPHFRDDYSPLPNNVRPRVQRVLRANREYAEQQARLAQMADEWRRQRLQNKNVPMPAELAKHLQGDKEHHHHIPHPHFYFHEMPTWVVPALNVAAYIYLCGLWGLGSDLLK